MSLSNQVDQIYTMVRAMYHTTGGFGETVDNIYEKLKKDIEPKLDMALEGKTATAATQENIHMDEKIRQLKLMLIYAADGRKIEAIRAIRTATGAGLNEAKDAVEWIEIRLKIIRDRAVKDYKDNNEQEAE